MIFLNLSPRALMIKEFTESVLVQVRKFGIAPERIVFEITERETVKNLELIETFVHQLRSEGFRFAVDDFGSGYSSLHYIKKFSVDLLKIDGEFIRDIAVNPVNQLVINAIVGIAQGMRKKTIAEFVGDANSTQLLRTSGVDYAQGYYIGLPRPVTEVLPVESQNSADSPAQESMSCFHTPTDPWYMRAHL